jgi:hypothetical protein
MATFTRATGSQQCPHCLGNSTLTTNYLAEIVRGNIELQCENISIITNFANLDGIWIIYQRFGDVLNKSTHFFPYRYLHAFRNAAAAARKMLRIFLI